VKPAPLNQGPRADARNYRFGAKHQNLVGTCLSFAKRDRARVPLSGAMKALIFPIGLWMMGTCKGKMDAQTQEPDSELCPATLLVGEGDPGKAVIHAHPIGHAVATKNLGQSSLDSSCGLIASGHQTERKARMIIEHGQWISASVCQSEVTFEIHLPEVIRLWVLESSIRLVLSRSLRGNQLVAMKNRRDGARRRNLWLFERLQSRLQLSPTPRPGAARAIAPLELTRFDGHLII
jgi:hypothetical protein